jgi:benzylsuccinate CoA-transferase BbsF subunit
LPEGPGIPAEAAPTPAPPGAAPTDAPALAGIRICDFTGQLAGAGATRTLAAFGAQVIRIEDPTNEGRWDILRGGPPFVDERRGINLSGAFNTTNCEKLGITLNLRTERGKELLRELVAISDVVTDNFAAGVLARLGFSFEELQAIRPDIVYVSNSGFGSTGPYARYRTWGPIVQAMSGLTLTSGLQDQPPAGWGYSYMDHQGANFMAIAILAAIAERDRTGQGQWVDMACTEVGLALNGPSILDSTVNDRPPRWAGARSSNRSTSPAMAPHGIYPCSGDDNWVALSCRDDADWSALASVIGTDWATSDRFERFAGRLADEDELDRLVATWTASRTREEVVRATGATGMPVAPVARPEERIDQDPSTAAWGMWPTVHHREMGDVRVEGLPIHLSRNDWHLRRGAPCLGEHNEEVYQGLLGLTTDELERLHEYGVV